jgi:hypothetical protein
MAQDYSLNLGLDILPITTDPQNLPDMYRLYNAVKGVAAAIDNYTGAVSRPKADWPTLGVNAIRNQNMSRLYIMTSEVLTAGMIVSIWDDAGTAKVRKAGGPALAGGLGAGFVLASFSAGEYCEVFLSGLNTGIAGMVPGTYYDLSLVTAGAVSTGVASPNKQTLGVALSATALWFTPTPFKY